jgi:hypothetical protein
VGSFRGFSGVESCVVELLAASESGMASGRKRTHRGGSDLHLTAASRLSAEFAARRLTFRAKGSVVGTMTKLCAASRYFGVCFGCENGPVKLTGQIAVWSSDSIL